MTPTNWKTGESHTHEIHVSVRTTPDGLYYALATGYTPTDPTLSARTGAFNSGEAAARLALDIALRPRHPAPEPPQGAAGIMATAAREPSCQ